MSILAIPFVLVGFFSCDMVMNGAVMTNFIFNFLTIICSMLLNFIDILGQYIFLLVLTLVCIISLLCFISYKTKPSAESFQKSLENIMTIIKVENSNKVNLTEWFIFRLQMFRISNTLVNYQYDCGICRIGIVKDNDKRIIFIGTLDTWLPIMTR